MEVLKISTEVSDCSSHGRLDVLSCSINEIEYDRTNAECWSIHMSPDER